MVDTFRVHSIPANSAISGRDLRSIPPVATQPAELNLRIFAALGRYIEVHHGKETLEAIAVRVGVHPSDLMGRGVWVSHAQAEDLLAAARELLPDDEDFKRACTFQVKSSYGPLAWAVRAMTPQMVFATACRTMGLVSRISSYETLESERNRVLMKYESTAPESRAMCLSRMAQFHLLPTFYGLPAATLNEHACLAQGDPACIYEITWFESRRWYPAIVGAILGAIPLVVMSALSQPLGWHMAVLPLLLATTAQMLELRRANQVNLEIGGKTADALREIARQEAETRLELLALSQRQNEWSRLM